MPKDHARFFRTLFVKHDLDGSVITDKRVKLAEMVFNEQHPQGNFEDFMEITVLCGVINDLSAIRIFNMLTEPHSLSMFLKHEREIKHRQGGIPLPLNIPANWH